MQKLLYEYNLDLTTWVYLSSLLILTAFFKFSPLFRVRNLDMLAIVAIAPAVVMMQTVSFRVAGYCWMLALGMVWILRLVLDPLMVRRPLLEPNLNTGGMTFLGAALLVFLTTHAATRPPETDFLWPHDPTTSTTLPARTQARLLIPATGSPLMAWCDPPPVVNDPAAPRVTPRLVIGRVLGILAHFMVVAGLITMAWLHYNNLQTGIAVATLYLLMPSTALAVDRFDHALPAAIILWSLIGYRHPWFSGLCLGGAAGLMFYPVFLLPLWCSFYWPRGLMRFLKGFAISSATALLVAGIVFGFDQLGSRLLASFGWDNFELLSTNSVWGTIFVPAYRLPMQVAFLVLCGSMALWPVEKNLGSLLSCSAVVMLATQFWQPLGGGSYVSWFLPLIVMTVFRPNLQDHVALSVVTGGTEPKARVGRQAA